MTTGQKKVTENFKKAIAYRKKTGVSLKEAFAHIYPKKVATVKNKKKFGDVFVTYPSENEAEYIMERGYHGEFKGHKRIAGTEKKYTKKQPKKIVKDWTNATDMDVIKNFVPYLEKDIRNGKPEWAVIGLEKKNGKWVKNLEYIFNNLKEAKEYVNAQYGAYPKIVKSNKMGSIKRKAAPKKKTIPKKVTSSHKDNKSHNVNIKVVSGLHTIGKIEASDFTRISNDIYGNPRYVLHFLQLLNDQERLLPFNGIYDYALKKAKKMGGKKFSNKQYGGGVVFQSYNIYDLSEKLEKLKNL